MTLSEYYCSTPYNKGVQVIRDTTSVSMRQDVIFYWK